MKKSLILFLILLCSRLYAIEPPIDIVEFDYEKLIDDGEGVLGEDEAVFNYIVKYLSEDIKYSVHINLDDTNFKYMFFSRNGVDYDTFYRYFLEIFKYYLDKSLYVYVEDEYKIVSKWFTAKRIYFHIENMPIVTLYMQNSYDDGFYGFGISIEDETQFIDNIENRVSLVWKKDIEDIKHIDYKDIKEGQLYISDDVVTTINEVLKNSETVKVFEEDNVLLVKQFFLPYLDDYRTEYEIKIFNEKDNEDLNYVYIVDNANDEVYIYYKKNIDIEKFIDYGINDDVYYIEFIEQPPIILKTGSKYSFGSISIYAFLSNKNESIKDIPIDINIIQKEY